MALALEKTVSPGLARPAASPEPFVEKRLNIDVVFTSVEGTLAALRKAGDLAVQLGARITIVVPQIVPQPLPLDSPPVLLDWSERRFEVIARNSTVETTVHIYLCRDRVAMLRSILRPNSLVVLGGPKRWWPTSEKRLARKLHDAGHEVVIAEME